MSSGILMFNPKDRCYFFISPNDRAKIAKMKEDGFIENPLLVAMYDPKYKKHEMVMIQDQKEWESKGYFAGPTMIYHPTEGTQMVSEEDSKKAIRNGWYLSPAHFPGNEEGRIKTPNVRKEAA